MAEQLATSPWQQMAAIAAQNRLARETARAGEHMQPVQHNMFRRCLAQALCRTKDSWWKEEIVKKN